MSNIASINFKKTKPEFQVWHNDRTLSPEYLISQKNIELNRTGLKANALRDRIIANAKSEYFKRTKQRCQAKHYLWSAALNIKADTTMAELENLAKYFKDKYGIQCYQIAIHKDEGYKNEDGTHLNNHAHMEFVTLDERGINRQRDFGKRIDGKKLLSHMQDDVARLLKMERGVSVKKSKTKRIEPRVWAKLKEEEARYKKFLKEHYERLSDERVENERKAKQDEILEFQNKLRVSNQQNIELQNKIKAQNETLSSKKFLSDEEIKKIRIKTQNNVLEYLIDKLDEINESDSEVEAFMYRGDEPNKLLDKLYKNIRALMRANARNRLNEANKQERDFNELLREIGRLKYEIEIGEPNREFKERIVYALKRFNPNTLAKIIDIEPKYDVSMLDDYNTIRNIAILTNTLEFFKDTCLDVAKRYDKLASKWNACHDEKVSYLKDREDLQIASELSNSKNASDEDLNCFDEPENFRLKM